MTKRNKAPPKWRRLLPTVDSVTIVGLGGIGRQVAVQLAALGVPRLQLVDARTVARSIHATEGYTFEDVGRLRVHATAHMCHQIDPQLEIHAIPKTSLSHVDAGDVVFCCPGSRTVWRLLKRSVRPNVVVARCDVIGNKLQLDFARGVSVVADRVDRLASSAEGEPSSPHPAIPAQVATVAAGLLVMEYLRFSTGEQPRRTVQLDLETLRLEVEEPG